MIHYSVTPIDPNAHHFEVTCTIEKPNPAGQQFSLPAWIPGSYMIRDFARNILWLQASTDGKPVHAEKLDKQCWRCEPCNGPLTVQYRVYAWDLSVRSAHLDQTHGFFNGTSLFLMAEGQQAQPHKVSLLTPSQLQWCVATTLPVLDVDEDGWGDYQCDSYQTLIDHPVEMGTFEQASFDVLGVPHALIVTGRHEADLQRIAGDLQQVCELHCRFFGEDRPPLERFLFLTTVVGEGYGGLEHRDSTALICSRGDLPRAGEEEVSEGYRKFLGLCSHEYFHLWNVKRIKPAVFTPYRLAAESYTRQLWAYEGITSYYDDLALVRSGLISRESYLELLGQMLTRLQRSGGERHQSVTDSSLEAWTKFYKQDENAGNAIVSYYTKGAVIALMIDLHIRQQSAHQQSLQQVMQQLWQQYGKSGVGTDEDTIEQLCHQTAGGDIPFLQEALYSTNALDVAQLLEPFGIQLCNRAASSGSDKGGTASEKLPTSWLGMAFKGADSGLKVTAVVDGGPAQQAGIAAGDQIIALDQIQADDSRVKEILRSPPEDQVTVHLFRRDELMEVSMSLRPPPSDTVYLQIAEPMTETQRTALNSWLGNVNNG